MRTFPRLAIVFFALLSISACTRVGRTPPRPIARPAPPVALDELHVVDPEPGDAGALPARRLVTVRAEDADLRAVVFSLAREVGLDVVVDPDVSGTVTIDVTEVPFPEALEAILGPAGHHYRLQAGLLRVYGTDFQTRLFTVDYVNNVRVGTTRMTASSGGTASGEGSGGGGESGENRVSVDSAITSDHWHEIVAGLELIVFGDAPGGAESIGGEDAGSPARPEAAARARKPRLVVHRHSGTVLVTAPFATLNRVADFLERIQGSAHRQVAIEARIVEVTLRDTYTAGIDWSRIPGTGDVTSVFGNDEGAVQQSLSPDLGVFQAAFSDGDFNFLLDALSTQGDVKVLSAPRVAALNNQKAVFKAAREESFFSQRVDFETQPNGTSEPILSVEPQRVTIGLVLDVTPQISHDGEIMMNIHPSITELVGEDVFPPGAEGSDVLANAPILDIREVDTVVRVRSNQLLVIGGLMKERRSEELRVVPFLGEIPILGHLFRQTKIVDEHVELVIALRPVVVIGRDANAEALRELERLESAF